MSRPLVIGSVAILALAVLYFTFAGTKKSPLDLTIYFTADANAQLEPCGCFTGQYGGMARIKTYIESQSPFSSLRVDVGNAIGGIEDYEQIRYGYVQQAFKLLKYDALNLGSRECGLSAQKLKSLSAESPVPLISANILDAATRKPLLPAYHVVERQGYRIACVGVVDPQFVEEPGDGLVIDSMPDALKRLLPILREKADYVVLLAFTDQEGLQRLAHDFYEFPIILGGKVPQPSQDITKSNRSILLYTTNETKSLGILSVLWSKAARPQVKAWDMVLMTDEIPLAPEITSLTKSYRNEIRQAVLDVDRDTFQNEHQVPGVRPTATYVGSDKCAACHQESYSVWKQTKHSHAFDSLKHADSDADPSCIGCHTVGFTRPSGFHRKQVQPHLTDVGCESCHGPGSAHVTQHESGGEVLFHYRKLTENDCRSCHHGKFSRPFEWESWWPKVAHSEPKKK